MAKELLDNLEPNMSDNQLVHLSVSSELASVCFQASAGSKTASESFKGVPHEV